MSGWCRQCECRRDRCRDDKFGFGDRVRVQAIDCDPYPTECSNDFVRCCPTFIHASAKISVKICLLSSLPMLSFDQRFTMPLNVSCQLLKIWSSA